MRAVLLVLLAGALASCGGNGEAPAAAVPSASPGTTRFADERRGFEVTFPSDWHRAEDVLTPALIDPSEILSLGTGKPVPNGGSSGCAQHPTASLARVGPRDVFVTVQERRNRTSGEMAAGPPQLAPVTPDASELSACLDHRVPFETYWMPFRSGERGFYAHAAIGDDASPERVAQLQAVLDSLVFRETRVIDDRQRGVRFSYAAPWREYPFALTEAVELRHQIALGTFALDQPRPDPDCSPVSALRARGEDGGLLLVFEYPDLTVAQLERFPPRPSRFGGDERGPRSYECFGESHLIRWREPTAGDRAFQAHVYGTRRWVEQALGILDSFEISAQGE